MRIPVCFVVASIVGCSDPFPTPLDAGPADAASEDAETLPDCPSGTHRCGDTCIADDDTPSPLTGCKFGCGPCSYPENGTATCGADGQCDFACKPGFVREGQACVCKPKTCADLSATCGTASDGCGGTLACGTCGDVLAQRCLKNACTACKDKYEPNDLPGTPTGLGVVTDDPDSNKEWDDVSLHGESDVDFYSIAVNDTGFGGNPNITVEAAPQVFGQELEIAMWPRCSSGSPSHTVSVGLPDSTYGSGCVSKPGATPTSCRMTVECSGTGDDHTVVLIRVRAKTFTPVCGAYVLKVRVT